jgi:7-cyano-7-deazaguanine synthase in queuosine biosynthesis
MAHEYLYRFDANGQIRCQSNEVWCPTAMTSLDGVRTTTWLGPFGSPERDLLRVMAAALVADRLSPRRPQTVKRLQRDLGWQRRLQLRVCVESPDRWSSAASDLRALLSFMTDDAWEFEFEGISTTTAQQQLLPLERTEDIREVALFSGGLDSVAGTFARRRQATGSILAVSACGNDVRGAAQKTALEALRSLGIKANWLKVAHQLRGARRSRSGMEPSQRSRGLLFLAMGTAAASQLTLDTFSVYETGTGCINMPISAAQVGAQCTRAMHPRTLALFNQLVPRVLDRPVRAIAPFFLCTKGELCAFAGESLAALAKVSMSCDEGEGHKADAMLHCGLCTSCLFRRIALHAGGLVPDPTRYRDVTTRRHSRYEVIAFENHATTLRSCRSLGDLVDMDPDARFATTLPMVEALNEDSAAAAVFAMYQRYAAEIQAYFGASRPTVAMRSRQARKERDRDLFSAVG